MPYEPRSRHHDNQAENLTDHQQSLGDSLRVREMGSPNPIFGRDSRLTLNMLLSFAQFEREVTGERIRDKIAASKKKGMWMGRVVPLGYDVAGRKLIVNSAEAETVRHIYRRYLALGSVFDLQDELREAGIISNVRPTRASTRRSSTKRYGGPCSARWPRTGSSGRPASGRVGRACSRGWSTTPPASR